MAKEWVEKKKNHAYNNSPNPSLPSPPLLPLGPSEVKWLAPKWVWTSLMRRTLLVRFSQGLPPVSKHFIFSYQLRQKKTNKQTTKQKERWQGHCNSCGQLQRARNLINLIILIVFLCEVRSQYKAPLILATLRMAQLVLSIFLPILHAKRTFVHGYQQRSIEIPLI